MTQHTQEPWARGKRLLDIVSSKGNLVARLAGTVGKCEIEDANLRRIVACVNAMSGIADDNSLFFQGNSVRSVISNMKLKELDLEQQRNQLQAQVDELLKAAENLLSNVVFVNFSGEWKTSFVEDADLTEYCQPLQDVINKITGETK